MISDSHGYIKLSFNSYKFVIESMSFSAPQSIYSMGDFPLPHLNELREKYRYNIRPISQPSGNSKKNGKRSVFKSILNSDEDDLDDDDIAAMACLPG